MSPEGPAGSRVASPGTQFGGVDLAIVDQLEPFAQHQILAVAAKVLQANHARQRRVRARGHELKGQGWQRHTEASQHLMLHALDVDLDEGGQAVCLDQPVEGGHMQANASFGSPSATTCAMILSRRPQPSGENAGRHGANSPVPPGSSAFGTVVEPTE